MSVSSPCEICGVGEVSETCTRCAQLVCEDHFDQVIGLCVECASEVGDRDRPGRHVPEDAPDGVDTYRF